MKSDLKSGSLYHIEDRRIVAHLQTSFMALLLILGIERLIANRHPILEHFPKGI